MPSQPLPPTQTFTGSWEGGDGQVGPGPQHVTLLLAQVATVWPGGAGLCQAAWMAVLSSPGAGLGSPGLLQPEPDPHCNIRAQLPRVALLASW